MIKEQASIEYINGHKIALYYTKAASNSKSVVIFCHGFRSSSIGPNRFFVRAAREFAWLGVDTIRFDQYGSGNSEGDFLDSSFNDWIATTVALCRKYLDKGYRVCLFGQSMGGSTVIAVAAQIPEICCVVSWVPDPSVDEYDSAGLSYHEECGERVGNRFWLEAHEAHIPKALTSAAMPMYIVQCGDDEYVSPENHEAITSHTLSHHVVDMYEGYLHSRWTYDQATAIIDKSVSFIMKHLATTDLTLPLQRAVVLLKQLKKQGVDPILYGSIGVSVYLGNFKDTFGDIDLLVPDKWLDPKDKWSTLQPIMQKMGFTLIDEHEHEFRNDQGQEVAFAGESVLVRDGIVSDLKEIIRVELGGVSARTLSVASFKKAYEFSVKDGYRLEQRGKNDQEVIGLLDQYIARNV
jgi:dienelactone hydrolase